MTVMSKIKPAVLFISGTENSRKAQLECLTSYCNNRGFTILKTFECEGMGQNHHKTFNKMIEYVEGSKSKIDIVIYDISRLQDDCTKCLALKELYEQKGTEFHFVKEALVIHKNISATELVFWDMIILTMNRYRTVLQDHIKRSLHFNYCNGRFSHMVPIGYLNSRDSNNKPDIILDSSKAPVIVDLFKEYATGKHSISTLTQEARKRGLKTRNGDISKDCIRHMLSNPFYYGEFCIKGELYQHKYPTVIDKSLFDAVQEVLKSKRR